LYKVQTIYGSLVRVQVFVKLRHLSHRVKILTRAGWQLLAT